jgi:hypothetical protein
MLETLLKLLAVDTFAPEIMLEEDGDLCLDYWGDATISINAGGGVNWATTEGRHGTDLNEFIEQTKRLSGRRMGEIFLEK